MGLDLPTGADNRVLSPEQWEQRLVSHYLRSDGPLGGSPLTYLDATPAEIAIAADLPGLDEVVVQDMFLAHFDRRSVYGWLSGDDRPRRASSVVPGYFRYLVLTGLVSATEKGAGSTHNFRTRLGELFRAPGAFANVSGVNGLWRSLVTWGDQRRAKGEPIRRIELPPEGNMTHIGHAVRIAFPSWDDRRAMRKILEKMTPDVRTSPVWLVQELSRQRHAIRLSRGIAEALTDFSKARAAGRRMLLGHRFWRLVASINESLEAEAGSASLDRWRLSVQFCGFEQDDVLIRLFRGRSRLEDTASWQGSLQDFSLLAPSKLPSTLVAALKKGFFLLAEAPGATWQVEDIRRSNNGRFVVLARNAIRPELTSLRCDWRKLEGAWSVSEPLAWNDVKSLSESLLTRSRDDGLEDLVIRDGVLLGRSVWLGRPGFLPYLTAPNESSLELESIGKAPPGLTLGRRPQSWDLNARSPISGHWRVTASEAGHETERVLCLEADAPERREFPEVRDLDLEVEVVVDHEGLEHLPASFDDDPSAEAGPMDHILEAIYTAPSRGWSEADLLYMLAPVMPAPHFGWDMLRGLAEAGWLKPMLSRSWRARTWHLVAPRLVPISIRSALVEGSLGASARLRLAEAVVSAGGRTVINWGDPSLWVAPIIVADNVDVSELASSLNWPIHRRTTPHLGAAPSCWPNEPRSEQGRIVMGSWHFEAGHFVPRPIEASPDEVTLDRLVREKMDDRDVFRIRGRGPQFVTTSRTTAILEAYRRRQVPVFVWDGNSMRRTTKSGHLPLPVGIWLRRRILSSPGPMVHPDGSWSYLYPSDRDSASSLERAFGKAIAGPQQSPSAPHFIARAAMARRQTRAPSWYSSAPSLWSRR